MSHLSILCYLLLLLAVSAQADGIKGLGSPFLTDLFQAYEETELWQNEARAFGPRLYYRHELACAWADKEKLKSDLQHIITFAEALATLGPRVILVPVPPKWALYPTSFSPHDSTAELSEFWSQRYLPLRNDQFEVLNTLESFSQLRREGHEVFHELDTHWNQTAIRETVSLLVERLENAGISARTNPIPFKEVEVRFKGDLTSAKRMNLTPYENTLGPPQLCRVALNWKSTPAASILVVGDSYSGPHCGRSDSLNITTEAWGLPAQLSIDLGCDIESLFIKGSGIDAVRMALLRRVHTDPNYVRNRSAIIWVFASRDLGSGIKPVPIEILK